MPSVFLGSGYLVLVALCSGYALLPPIFSVLQRSLVQVPQLASFPFKKAWTLFLFGSNRMWTVSRLNRTWSYTMNRSWLNRTSAPTHCPASPSLCPHRWLFNQGFKFVPPLRRWLFNQTSFGYCSLCSRLAPITLTGLAFPILFFHVNKVRCKGPCFLLELARWAQDHNEYHDVPLISLTAMRPSR